MCVNKPSHFWKTSSGTRVSREHCVCFCKWIHIYKSMSLISDAWAAENYEMYDNQDNQEQHVSVRMALHNQDALEQPDNQEQHISRIFPDNPRGRMMDVLHVLPQNKVLVVDMGDERECAICHETVKLQDNLRVLPCDHQFHQTCVDVWLLQKHSCPLCRINVLDALAESAKAGPPPVDERGVPLDKTTLRF